MLCLPNFSPDTSLLTLCRRNLVLVEAEFPLSSSQLLCNAGKASHKAVCALMRSYAYLLAKQWEQALADAKVAAVYSAGLGDKRSSWPRSFAAISSAIEGTQVERPTANLLSSAVVNVTVSSRSMKMIGSCCSSLTASRCADGTK